MTRSIRRHQVKPPSSSSFFLLLFSPILTSITHTHSTLTKSQQVSDALLRFLKCDEILRRVFFAYSLIAYLASMIKHVYVDD